ncbi:glycosyltransferase family 4 protein [Lacimicrobium alkaliphilum]|uniref:Glycosyl transferase family 1 domain-containing protein n=1 Tax=Lacimicrobium alkaliphilum TaxID=1526571 RepID=A0A0U3AC92_9ALTE|nr:glycosyltransferase [Lacimicrobium alkaliphilum]ALS98654.1 hypothetical protein AT746_10485 [Lacimicrobium alkaliphilum]
MKLIVCCEYRFLQTPDGQVWTRSAFTNSFWQRYLQVFSELTILARVEQAEQAEQNWHKVTGPGVSITALPYYLGLNGLVKSLPALLKTLHRALRNQEALIFRVPSQTAMLARLIRPQSRFALEVVGDPADVFSAGITGPLLDKLLGRISAWQLRRMTKNALAVSYVTRTYLQKRYPAPADTPQVACSSISLTPEWFADAPRHYDQPATELLFVGSFAQLYKGQDVLLQALSILRQQGTEYRLTMVGGGEKLAVMQQLASELGLDKQIHFAGEQPHQKILSYMKNCDVFVLPSRTEGLPRVMLEAMATAMPAIGSDAGGIPELLGESRLAPAGNPQILARRIADLCSNPDRLTEDSEINLETSRQYRQDKLDGIRRHFYQQVKLQFSRDKR